MDRPKISVITITYNSERFLRQTIESVIAQSYSPIEYIIIDGASTDGSIDIIRRYESHLTAWISERDGGIAEAMNKGALRATGDLVLFLHSDDYLTHDQVIEEVVATMQDGYEIYAASVEFAGDTLSTLLRPRGLNWKVNFKTGLLHQGVFCRRDLFSRVGAFDVKFKIAMDYDFFLRAFRQGAQVQIIDSVLSVMRNTGISSRRDWPSLAGRFSEERAVHRKNCPGYLLAVLYRVYWALYLPYRRVLSLVRPQSESVDPQAS